MSLGNEHQFMLRLSEGLAGYLGLEQAKQLSGIYSEHMLYPTIYEIAKARGLKPVSQWPVPNQRPGPGKRRTIDFLFEDEKKFVGLEVKFAKANKEHKMHLTQDAYKLGELPSQKNGKDLINYILIVSNYQHGLVQRLEQTGESRELTAQVKSILTPPTKLPSAKTTQIPSLASITGYRFGWSVRAPALQYPMRPQDKAWRFYITVLKQQNWWLGQENEYASSDKQIQI